MMDNPLDDLFWRDEILQIMYWFQGEGFGEVVTPEELYRFLAQDAPDLTDLLITMVEDGWLAIVDTNRYRLTELGRKEGSRRFADAFEELTKPAHGECSADCDCQGDPAKCKYKQPEHDHSH
jgi:hypothetical protein